MTKVTDINEYKLKKQDEYLERVMDAKLLSNKEVSCPELDEIEKAMNKFFGVDLK